MAKKAEYQLSSSVNEGTLEIVITGEVTANTIKNVDEEIHTLLKTTESRVILIDIRAVSGRLGTVESYFHVQNYSSEMQRADIALVDLEEYADLQSFYETAASNAGMSLKYFTDIDTARNWLKRRQRLRTVDQLRG